MPRRPVFENLLRWAVLVVTVVLPCFFGFLTTYVLLLLLLVTIVYLLLRRGERALRLDLAGQLFLVGYGILAACIAIDALAAGAPQELIYVFDFGMLLLYAPLASLYDRSADAGNSAVVADLSLAGVVIAFGLGVYEELATHPERAGYLRSDPIRYADTAVILGFLALIGLLAHKGARRWIYLLGPLFGLGATLMSGSRSALLAFPLMVIVATGLLVERKRIAFAIGTAVIAVFAIGFAVLSRFSLSRSLTVFDLARNMLVGSAMGDEAARERLAVYRAGLQAFWHAPIFGQGWRRKMDSIAPYLHHHDKALARLPHLHDETLNFAVGMGLFGVVAYGVLIALPIIVCLRSPRDSQYRIRLYGCALLVGSYITLGLADVMLGFELHTALYVALTALLLSFCRDAPAPRPIKAAKQPQPLPAAAPDDTAAGSASPIPPDVSA